MSDNQPTVIQLFRKWRGGDESAGQEMAQKFSDWYYAISTIRVPGQEGRPPMEAACQSFAQGIITVTRPRALVDWAHDLLERELAQTGYGLNDSKPTGSDNPNAMTRDRSPVELLQNVADQIDPSQRRVLALAYDPTVDLSVVDKAADPLGGTPFAMLEARYALKRALKASQDVPFAVVPDQADMDRAPISLYEAHRLASGKEISELEKWLLSDIDLCKDIAEFSAFVHALRGGALKAYAELDVPAAVSPEPQPDPTPQPPPAAESEPTPTPEPPPAPAPQPEPEPEPAPAPQPEPTPPAPQPEPAPEAPPAPAPTQATSDAPAKKSNLRSVLIIGATFVSAIILIILMIVFALQAG